MATTRADTMPPSKNCTQATVNDKAPLCRYTPLLHVKELSESQKMHNFLGDNNEEGLFYSTVLSLLLDSF
jgi:hypothetical protein